MTEPRDLSNKRDWVHDQLDRAGIPEEYQSKIEQLLEDLWSWSEDSKTTVMLVDTFSELAKGHALVPDEPEAVWIQAKPGMLVVRDQVRVKADAYTGPDAPRHNGREGVIVAIRYGDIHVRYPDEKELVIVKHKAEALEKRIR